MPELAPIDPQSPDAPLHGLAVLECAGEFCGYAGRLLADLGATVTRVRLVPGEADDAASRAPHRGKFDLLVDPGSTEGRHQLETLVASSDIVLQSRGAGAIDVPELQPEAVRTVNPQAIHVALTPFGLDGPAAELPSTDLIRLAAGGLLWLGGYPDTEPVAPYGEQSTAAVAIWGVISALLALIERDRTGTGHSVEVSAQEVVTQALETSVPEYELTGKTRKRLGDAPREAGTGVYACADGFVSMVAGRMGTTKAWKSLCAWLVEAGIEGADVLFGQEWTELEFRQRPDSVARFGELFGAFAAERKKHELYIEAQRRSIALAPVNTPADVLADPQLVSRRFFDDWVDLVTGEHVTVPLPPFRFSDQTDPAALRAPDPATPAAAS